MTVFVEAGAYDGYYQCNTNRLESVLNWRGVLVAPTPDLCWEAVRERRQSRVFNCAGFALAAGRRHQPIPTASRAGGSSAKEVHLIAGGGTQREVVPGLVEL